MIDEVAIRIMVLSGNLDEVDYYALLEIPPDASIDAVRDGFHEFALRFHPDQHIGEGTRQQQALAIFKRGAEAYRVLMNPTLRARYDAVRAQGKARLPTDAMQISADGSDSGEIPSAARVFFDKAVAELGRGNFASARMHLALALARGDSPRFDTLAREITEAAERARKR